jgi:hypothetical protein
MKAKIPRSRSWHCAVQEIAAICCVILLVPGEGLVLAQAATQSEPPSPAPANTAKEGAVPDSSAAVPEAKLPPEQLESLVAPIALYPDALLAQTLVASTYPLEIIQLQQWLAKNPDLKDQALADAVAKQPWDPSIQSMAAFPDVVKRLADDIQWTTELGNAFLAQQAEVMDAVQRMRKKAQDAGALESNEQQKVETKVVEQKTIIIVESTNPEVIYVPVYSPTVVYGPPIYPYPPIYYPPPPPPGAAFMAFSLGVMVGAAYHGGTCCGCGWGGNTVNINVNNNYNQINHNVNRGGGSGNWQHNPQHRGGAPYGNQATANRYGSGSRSASASNTKASAGKPSAGQQGSAGASNRASAGAGSASVNKTAAGGSGKASSGTKSSGFGGGSSGYSGSSAKASSSRGASSMKSSSSASSTKSSGGASRGGSSRGGGGGRR